MQMIGSMHIINHEDEDLLTVRSCAARRDMLLSSPQITTTISSHLDACFNPFSAAAAAFAAAFENIPATLLMPLFFVGGASSSSSVLCLPLLFSADACVGSAS